MSNLTARMVSVGLALVATPVIVRALGEERYGVYATITMVFTLLSFSDLGVGNGLITRLAAAQGRESDEDQRWLVSTAFLILFVVALAISVFAVISTVVVPWPSTLGTALVPEDELRAAVLVFALLFALSLPAGIGQKVLLGLQRGPVASAWLLSTTATSLAATSIAAAAGARLPVVVAATAAPAVALGTVQSFTMFRWRYRELRPRVSDVTRDRTVELLRVSGLFFLLAMAAALAFQTDLLVVAAVLGATSAAVFSISMRMFGLLTQATAAMMSQLWPAFAEALARGDRAWVRRTLLRTMMVSAAVNIPAVAALVVAGPTLIRWWVGPTLVPPTILLVAQAAWTVQQCVMYPMAYLMNGAEIVRFQLVATSSMALANIGASVLLTMTIGISGPIWASLITHALLLLLPAAWLVRRHFLIEPPAAPVEPELAR